MNKISTSIALVLLVNILTGCAGSSGPIPDDQFYRLSGKPLQSDSNKILLNGSLEISRFNAKSLYNERAILYTDKDQPLKLRQYHYHYWADSPAQMVQDSFATIFSRAGLAINVSVSSPRIEYVYSVSGNVLRFERIVGGGDDKALVSLSLALTKRGVGKPLILKTYTQEITSESGSLYSSIEAFNVAMSLISREFVKDVAEHCSTDSNMCGFN